MNLNGKDEKLDEEIERVILKLSSISPETEEYSAAVKNLQVLYQAREQKSKKISPDTLIIALTNIVGILLILNHEEMNVISSKALGFVFRGRP